MPHTERKQRSGSLQKERRPRRKCCSICEMNIAHGYLQRFYLLDSVRLATTKLSVALSSWHIIYKHYNLSPKETSIHTKM